MKSRQKFIVIVLIISFAFGACEKGFLNVNTDPNQVTESNITPELIFPQAAEGVGNRQASRNFEVLNYWLGYWSTAGDYAIDQAQTSYNIDNTFGDAIWQNHYNVLFDLNQTKVKALDEGDSVLAGAAITLSVKLWQELVDMFGDIPYSQAFNNNQYTQPRFDKAQDVYTALLKSLDTSILFLNKAARSSFATVDVINHGNLDLWQKFANTLRLRLLIRQSQVTGFNPTSELSKIMANGGVLQAGENITVNPGYQNASNKQSPFYANYGYSPTGSEINTLTRANAYFVNLLSSTNDPRISRFFRLPSAGGSNVIGTTYGLTSGNPTGTQSSGIGAALVQNASQDQWVYPAYESLFLQAEAVTRGWLLGDAQSAYKDAVIESFVWLGVPDPNNAATNYITNEPIANWTSAGTSIASQTKFIAYQKYIALAGVDPVEAYCDLRRLNMLPDNGYISANPGKITNTLPVRFPYPQSELTTNGANVQAEGSINIFTSKIFWQP